MPKQRVFISFDFDHDSDVKTMLVGQSMLPDSPFEFKDASVKEHLTGDWQEKVSRRLDNVDVVIVLCGTSTHTANGVAAELAIALMKGTPYFLLAGRANEFCTRPSTAPSGAVMYDWTWKNLKALIGGAR